jgi:hypothetical protein
MSTNSNWSNFVIPPLFSATIALVKNVLGEGLAPNNPVVWVDVGVNTGAYIVSDLITIFGIDKAFTDQTLQDGTNVVVEPLLHGLLTGVILPFVHSEPTIRGMTTSVRNNHTFQNGLMDGIANHIIADYASKPLVDLISSSTDTTK